MNRLYPLRPSAQKSKGTRDVNWHGEFFPFYLLAVGVFIERMCGGKVGDGAEFFWLVIALILFVIYAFGRKSSLLLVKENTTNAIEFIGTKYTKDD